MLASRQFPLEKRITASRKSSFSPKGQLVLKPAVKKPINNKKNQTYTTNKKHRCKSIHTKTLDWRANRSKKNKYIHIHSYSIHNLWWIQFSSASHLSKLLYPHVTSAVPECQNFVRSALAYQLLVVQKVLVARLHNWCSGVGLLKVESVKERGCGQDTAVFRVLRVL